jgi:peptidase E
VVGCAKIEDIHAHLLAQDVVWVAGGSVANLLALWRLHGVDTAMREVWEAGVVLSGNSAGSLCWHVGGATDSFGPAPSHAAWSWSAPSRGWDGTGG